MNEIKCDICQKQFSETDLRNGHGIPHEIERLIVKDFPDWNDNKRICKDDLNIYRMKYISSLIEDEEGKIQELETSVITSIKQNDIISSNINTAVRERLKISDRISDKIAVFGGSWTFIILFFIILFAWMLLNSYFLLSKPFDPFPYILLNLVLSCVAAIQAPIIMMSQNRQEMKDRMRSENDYKVDLKSEIEIRTLHEKVDHLLLDQWSKMMRIQEMQIEILEDIKKKTDTLE
jgi:uncharacterized membrane protein